MRLSPIKNSRIRTKILSKQNETEDVYKSAKPTFSDIKAMDSLMNEKLKNKGLFKKGKFLVKTLNKFYTITQTSTLNQTKINSNDLSQTKMLLDKRHEEISPIFPMKLEGQDNFDFFDLGEETNLKSNEDAHEKLPSIESNSRNTNQKNFLRSFTIQNHKLFKYKKKLSLIDQIPPKIERKQV